MAFWIRTESPPIAELDTSMFKRTAPLASAALAGAAFAYLFDPDRGKGRRAKLRDMTMGRARGTVRRAERAGRRVTSDAYGIRQRLTHRTPEEPFPDDATLAQKVRSEILGWGSEFDTASILVNAEEGIVVLRGQVDRPDQIEKLERQVRRLPGVVDVDNLLHLKGSPAPNKQEAVEASRGGLGRRA